MSIRLNKYVQENLNLSRRAFVSLVQAGKVFLNNEKVESYSQTVKIGDFLEIKGQGIKEKIKDLNKHLDVILFNKPVGFVCSKSDKHNKTIYEILPKEFHNYFYIGRLDKDSRGLLILTNDSALVDKLQHPKNNVEKEYLVQIDRAFSVNDYKKMKKGILDEGDLLTVKTAKFFEDKKKFFIKIILGEGKKRHIRRMLTSLGYKILDLQRVREAQFKLGNLKEGNWIRVNVQ
ncbi:MAG TPA: pseudouridine synthase [Candidatus Absconditabacterales bacterium]|nr:pseudouridine synthase [Candidatus Absconditabacterales bacterium]HRU50562.1 pseudouridine synthase [Candidatus Absconditabacterales bacterium]